MSLLAAGALDKMTLEGSFKPSAICEPVNMKLSFSAIKFSLFALMSLLETKMILEEKECNLPSSLFSFVALLFVFELLNCLHLIKESKDRTKPV